MRPLKQKVLFLILLLIIANASKAETSCKTCVEIKKEICNEECSKVAIKKIVACQADCINEWCSHQCEKDESYKYFSRLPECKECKKIQSNLCTILDKNHTAEELEIHKILCSEERCESHCLP